MMILIAIAFIIFSSFALYNVKNPNIRLIWIFVIFVWTFQFAYYMNIPGSYLSAMEIKSLVQKCQENIPAYQKCIITVSSHLKVNDESR